MEIKENESVFSFEIIPNVTVILYTEQQNTFLLLEDDVSSLLFKSECKPRLRSF